MRHQTAIAKERSRTRSTLQARENVDLKISRNALAAMGVASTLIGLWATACFVGALIVNGPLGLARGWLQAVTGL